MRCLHDDASSRSVTNAGVDVDYCTPRTGSLLTHPEFAKLDLWSPGAHTVCRRDCYRCGLYQRAPSCGAANWCRLDLACIDSAASAANLTAESKQRARPVPSLLQTGAGSLRRNAVSTP